METEVNTFRATSYTSGRGGSKVLLVVKISNILQKKLRTILTITKIVSFAETNCSARTELEKVESVREISVPVFNVFSAYLKNVFKIC